jgi:hypothetical protein
MWGWWNRRRERRERIERDARDLLSRNPGSAYYDAQRAAARARFAGDGAGFIHWARVAAEVARISDNPMDIATVEAIVADEQRRATHGSIRAR